MTISSSYSRYLHFFLWLTLVPLGLHWSFSWIGFNPTDDGVILAYSRRLLDGQIPHLDFISIRPVLSYLLHVPTLVIGSPDVLYFGRYIFWLQSAVIALMWMQIGEKLTGYRLNTWQFWSLASMTLFFNVHQFPHMLWTSIDGFMFFSVGIRLILYPQRFLQILGCFCIGLSPLTKQSFFFAPFALLALPTQWKKVGSWIAAALPSVLYICMLFYFNSQEAALEQLFSKSGFMNTAILKYLLSRPFWVGLIIGCWIYTIPNRKYALILFTALTIGTLYFGNRGLNAASFLSFGLLSGYCCFIAWRQGIQTPRLSLPLLALFSGWMLSISAGYNRPALALGTLLAITWIIYIAHHQEEERCHVPIPLMGFLCCTFIFLRTQCVYLESPAQDLHYHLGDHFAGGQHIYTNKYVYEHSKNLAQIEKMAEDRPFVIFPDFAAYWATAPISNPMPLDMVHPGELPNTQLNKQTYDALQRLPQNTLIAIQKYQPRLYPNQLLLEEKNHRVNPITEHTRKDFKLKKQMDYYILYDF